MVDWFKRAIRLHLGASLALATLLGLVIGLVLSERPPLDWTKWSVIGQWANVVVLIFVAWIGATLPQRLARQQRIAELGPLADELSLELEELLKESNNIAAWREQANYPTPDWMVFERTKIDELAENFSSDAPYLQHLVRQAHDSFINKMFYMLTVDIGTGEDFVVDRNKVEWRNITHYRKIAHIKANSALNYLRREYGISDNE
ncbi:hypothetical protein [Kordiimonas sp.]|uniref:hypothetical protein n=1 Tax=Kordiimonas sp. TaxID=1970157 RepID=UPI003B52C83F